MDKIPTNTWARYTTTIPRFGYDTSNIIKSLNSSWSEIRHLPPFRILDTIYLKTIETVYNRSIKKQ